MASACVCLYGILNVTFIVRVFIGLSLTTCDLQMCSLILVSDLQNWGICWWSPSETSQHFVCWNLPRSNWTYHRRLELSLHMNFVFSYPYQSFNPSWESIAIYIEKAAHHLDLRLPDPLDPQTVIDARALEKKTMQKWIDAYNSN